MNAAHEISMDDLDEIDVVPTDEPSRVHKKRGPKPRHGHRMPDKRAPRPKGNPWPVGETKDRIAAWETNPELLPRRPPGRV